MPNIGKSVTKLYFRLFKVAKLFASENLIIMCRFFALFFVFALLCSAIKAQTPNVLFIAVDDLRPGLGCYDHAPIKSSNIDKLAEQGLMINRAYCNIQVCSALQASVFSGIPPNRNRFVSDETWFDKEAPAAVSLPMHLKTNGYKTVSLGTIFHHKTDALIEDVDIYPSFCELAGLNKPFYLQGKSFVPLYDNPVQPWKDEVFCRWIKGETIVAMSDTYTEWFDYSGKLKDRMLYDLSYDPEETVNISENPKNKALMEQL